MKIGLLQELFDFHRNNETVYTELNDLIHGDTNPIVPFIGAGLSAPMIPTWYDFLHKILMTYEIDDDENMALLQSYQYEEVADVIHRTINTIFSREIERNFSVGKNFNFSQNSSLLYIPDIFEGLAVTTNLDNALEKAYGTRTVTQYSITSTDRFDSLKSQGHTILRIHGDTINNMDVVFAKKQYDHSYGEGGIDFDKQIPKALKQLFTQCRILFLGCSLEKDRVLQILESCESSVPRHFAVVQKPSESERYKTRLTWLSSLGIQPIWYPEGEHRFVNLILQGLSGIEHAPKKQKDRASLNLNTNDLQPCTLFEILGVDGVNENQIEKNWMNPQSLDDSSISVPVGLDSEGGMVNIDLHERVHGPHALVTGATGSGKSEFLRSFLLSLAFHYPPNKVSFIVLDVKGGGMANEFLNFPHLSGSLTSLSSIYVNRFLVSMKSELRRRQSLFEDCGVRNIYDYHKKYFKSDPMNKPSPLEPLPILVIAVDEFAEIKYNQPELICELTAVARIGRSFGIHLILATQNPSGVVDDAIWSITRLKVCFKTQTAEDSNEVLRIPNAAELTRPGQAIMSYGDESEYGTFSCAYGGTTVSKFVEQFDSVMDAITSCARKKGISANPIILPPLGTDISLSEVWTMAKLRKEEQDYGEIAPPVGLLDTIYGGESNLLTVDLSRFGNAVIFDKTHVGRNQFLETLILSIAHSYSPDKVQMTLIDFEDGRLGYLKNLLHMKQIVYWNEPEKISSIIEELSRKLADRRSAFATQYATSIRDYEKAIDTSEPLLVCIISGYDTFKRTCGDVSEIISLFKRSVSYGIYFVLSVEDPHVVSEENRNTFPIRLPIQLDNQKAYMTAMRSHVRYPPGEYFGRGLIQRGYDNIEFQTAKAFSEHESRVLEAKRLVDTINKSWKSEKAD